MDTVGPSEAYQLKLETAFPTLSFVVESKADFKYPIVGAASIAAKVTRDACLSYWTFLEKDRVKGEDESFGSGYPSGEPLEFTSGAFILIGPAFRSSHGSLDGQPRGSRFWFSKHC